MTTSTLASMLARSASADTARTALVAGDGSVSYGLLDTYARHFAGALQGLGIRPGEPVALLLPNVPHFSVAYFGCHYAASPVVPLNPLLTPDELAYHLKDSGAVALVAWESLMGSATEASSRTPNLRHRIVARADLGDLSAPEGWHNLVRLVGGAPAVEGPGEAQPDATAVVLYTSGTTGRPKGACLTHANLLSNALAAAEVVNLAEDTVALATLPLFHAFGMTVLHNAVLAVGGTIVLVPRFDPATVLELTARHRVTLFGGVPTMFAALLEAARPGDDLSSLRWCVSGGAPMPGPLMAAFEARFGVVVLEGYGLSEASPVVSFTVPSRPRTPGSIGYPLPGVEMHLENERGQSVESPGRPGEICVRGPGVMQGYLHNPQATSEVIVDGWLHTGDIGVIDEDGAYRIVDRKKDLIIRDGYNVYPREVETVLHGHPAVAMAAVVGVPHSRHGEEVKAVVTLRPGCAVSDSELVAYCRAHLAAYKYPRFVEVRDQLPVGPTGKVLKSVLRA